PLVVPPAPRRPDRSRAVPRAARPPPVASAPAARAARAVSVHRARPWRYERVLLAHPDSVNRVLRLPTVEFVHCRGLLLERGFPAPGDEVLAEPVAVAADAVREFHQVIGVGIGPRLVSALHRGGATPVLVTVESSPEVS